MNDFATILVVDDEPGILSSCEVALTRSGHKVDTASSAEEAVTRIRQEKYDAIVTDLKMPRLSGMDLLRIVKEERPETDVIMITGYGTIQTAVEAMKLGAFDYISKPFTPNELRSVVTRAIERRRLIREERAKARRTRVAFEYVMPDDLYYLPEHSWARMITEDVAEAGIDDVFQKTIGLVNRIELPSIGAEVEQGSTFAQVYGAGGKVYKLWSPVGGRVVEVNDLLTEDSSVLNSDPYRKGWIVRIQSSDLRKDLANLIDGDALIHWWVKREIVERKTSKYVKVSVLDPEFKHDIAKEPGGENIKVCFACGICTASCPIREIDSRYNPRKIIRMALLGMKERVIGSDFIWLCSSCYICTERCPQGVKFTEVINAIKNIAVKEGHVHPSFVAQMDILAKNSRLYPIDDFDNRKRESLGLPKLSTGEGSAGEICRASGLLDIVKRGN